MMSEIGFRIRYQTSIPRFSPALCRICLNFSLSMPWPMICKCLWIPILLSVREKDRLVLIGVLRVSFGRPLSAVSTPIYGRKHLLFFRDLHDWHTSAPLQTEQFISTKNHSSTFCCCCIFQRVNVAHFAKKKNPSVSCLILTNFDRDFPRALLKLRNCIRYFMWHFEYFEFWHTLGMH